MHDRASWKNSSPVMRLAALCGGAALLAFGCGSPQSGQVAGTPAAATAAAPAPATALPSAGSAAVAPSGPNATAGANATAAASARAATPKAAPKPMNVIVVTIDALRADMPWTGYPKPIAPRLSALAQESVVYTRAYSLSSYTAMSMAGYLAGRYPGELKRSGYFFSSHPEEETFFPELLTQRGVRTVAGHAHFYFDKKAGFHQGFADYRIVPGISADNSTDKNVTSPQHLAMAKEMLSAPANTSKQFFAWFHFMDPHDEYIKHEGVPDFGPRIRNRYDGEVHFTDRHVGQLIDFVNAQPWGKHTAIIISADHGEAFSEHKMSRHGFELWESLVRVPLIVHIPGVKPRTIDQPRSHIDLAPTIFSLLGAPVPDAFHGKSLLPEIRGEAKPEPRDVIIDLPRTSDNFRRRALVVGDYKLIAFGDDFRFELYNVAKDRAEKVDLRHREKARYKELKARYPELVKGINDICPKMRNKLKGKRKGAKC